MKDFILHLLPTILVFQTFEEAEKNMRINHPLNGNLLKPLSETLSGKSVFC